MRRMVFGVALAAMIVAIAPEAHAFCGFYVGKAGAELFNDASQVVLARDADRTIVTMSNDFKGNMTEFALVTLQLPATPLSATLWSPGDNPVNVTLPFVAIGWLVASSTVTV